MRIIQVVPYAMERPGGVQSHARDLSEWLTAQGHPTRIVAPPGTGGGTDPMVWTCGATRMLDMHGTRSELSIAGPRSLARIVARIREFGADLLHLHTPWTPALAWQVWRRARLPSVATFHATLPENGRPDLAARLILSAGRHFSRRVAATIVPSEVPREQWTRSGVSPAPLVLPPSIDLAPWRSAAAAAPPRDGGPALLFLGRLEPRKGVGTLAAAWPRIRAQLPGARLTVASPDTPTPDIAALIRSGGVSHVRAPAREEVQRLMAGSDFLLAPSLYGESFGLVLLEAMAAGALPIAADNAGYRTVLTGPLSALLVAPGDADALARRVVDLAGDGVRRAALRQVARDCAARHDIAAVGPRYLALYARVLGKPC